MDVDQDDPSLLGGLRWDGRSIWRNVNLGAPGDWVGWEDRMDDGAEKRCKLCGVVLVAVPSRSCYGMPMRRFKHKTAEQQWKCQSLEDERYWYELGRRWGCV